MKVSPRGQSTGKGMRKGCEGVVVGARKERRQEGSMGGGGVGKKEDRI